MEEPTQLYASSSAGDIEIGQSKNWTSKNVLTHDKTKIKPQPQPHQWLFILVLGFFVLFLIGQGCIIILLLRAQSGIVSILSNFYQTN